MFRRIDKLEVFVAAVRQTTSDMETEVSVAERKLGIDSAVSKPLSFFKIKVSSFYKHKAPPYMYMLSCFLYIYTMLVRRFSLNQKQIGS